MNKLYKGKKKAQRRLIKNLTEDPLLTVWKATAAEAATTTKGSFNRHSIHSLFIVVYPVSLNEAWYPVIILSWKKSAAFHKIQINLKYKLSSF